MTATGCVKLKFSTKRDAKRFLKAHRHNNGYRIRHVYECAGCGYWHLTSKTAGTRWTYRP